MYIPSDVLREKGERDVKEEGEYYLNERDGLPPRIVR